MNRKAAKRILMPIGVMAFGYVVYQGIEKRIEYKNRKPLAAPTGPQQGIEGFIDGLKVIKDEIIDVVEKDISMMKDIPRKIQELPSTLHDLKERVPQTIQELPNTLHDLKERVPHKLKDIADAVKEIKDLANADDQTSVVSNVQLPIANIDNYNSVSIAKMIFKDNPQISSLKYILFPSLSTPSGSNTSGVSQNGNEEVAMIILGDSLVAGVGSEPESGSPVLSAQLSSIFSVLCGNGSVRWHSAGKIGATARDLRQVVFPSLKERLKQSYAYIPMPKEIVVVVVVGLNDWRTLFEHFPRGLGHLGFRTQLQFLVDEVEDFFFRELPLHQQAKGVKGAQLRRPNVKIVLPALPRTILGSDPECSLNIFPLSYLVDLLCQIWDTQKHSVAVDNAVLREALHRHQQSLSTGPSSDNSGGSKIYTNVAINLEDHWSDSLPHHPDDPESEVVSLSQQRKTNAKQVELESASKHSDVAEIVYVGCPSISASYARPGPGNVTADLIHPSNQGCKC
jgi:uncharacterized protein YoxC